MSANSPLIVSTHIVYRCVYKGIIGPPSPSPRSARGNVRGISERKERERGREKSWSPAGFVTKVSSLSLPPPIPATFARFLLAPLLRSPFPIRLTRRYRGAKRPKRRGREGRSKEGGMVYCVSACARTRVHPNDRSWSSCARDHLLCAEKSLRLRHRYRLRCRRAA